MPGRLSPPEAAKLILAGRAPAGLSTGVLDLSLLETKRPVTLPEGLTCYSLSLAGQPLVSLPAGLSVEYKLDVTGCAALQELPRGLRVSTLVLANCTGLTALPEDLETHFRFLDGCTALRHWPESAQVRYGWVRARGCAALRALPAHLGPLASLDLLDCRLLERVPEGVQVQSWIDLGGTRINSLPEALSKLGLRWRGIQVTPQIAFFPETLTGRGILAEPNAELRRVMIERVGFEKFLREVEAKVLHQDQDAGGERRLLQVPLANDEPIVVVSLHCPSTGRHYLVRVPPTMKTCRQAVAWTAGFDDPDTYLPIAET